MKQYILIAMLGCSIQIHAQTATKDTTLQRILILEKEYNPIIDKASKINILPEIKEPQAPQVKIEFSNFSTPANIQPEPSQVDAAQYFTDLESSKKKGYVRAGISTFVNVDGDAGYQILNNETDELSVWFTHRSSYGNVKSLQTNDKKKLELNDNIGAFRYSHNFGASKLFADAKYTFSKFNDFGGVLLESPLLTNNILDANLGFFSKNTLPLNIFSAMNFTHFRQKDKTGHELKDNMIRVNFDFNKDFDSDKLIGLAGYFRTNSYSVLNYTDPITDIYKHYIDWNFNFNPYFKMEGDNWKMRLGAFAHLLLNQKIKIIFTPDVELSFKPYESGLLYLTAKGKVADNSYSNIFYENRYISPVIRVSDSYTQLNGTVGFKTTVSGIFDVDFYTGYEITEREHFYLSTHISHSESNDPALLPYNIIYYDTKVFKLGTKLKYQYQKMFDISLKAINYHWKVNQIGAEAWNKPSFESDLTAGFQFQTIPLRTDLTYHLEAGRKSRIHDIVNMKNINEVNLMGTYTFNHTLSIFAKIDNLLNQQYDIWYGYPAQGTQFMGGLSVKF